MAKSKLTTKEREARKNESKSDRFIRLAQPRTSRIIKGLKQLAQLGAANYESTELQRKAIETALKAAVESTLERLRKVKAPDADFTLPKA